MRFAKWLATAAAIGAINGAPSAQIAATAPAPAPVLTPLPATQALFDSYVRDGKMPGIVGAFGVGDLPTRFVSAGRIADEPAAPVAGPDSLWRIYSMTKPVTGMAAMILVEEGKLRLDDPVSKYFPGFAKMRVLTSPDTSLDSIPAKNPILIRHLLTHSAGLSYNIMAKGPLLKEYERLGLLPGAVNAAVEAQARLVRPKTLTEFAARLATVPLIAEPGTKWSYSVGLDLMGAVIEKASGMPFERFVQVKLFDPLKMNSTYWTVPAGEAGRLASNYTFVAGRRVLTDPGAESAWLTPPSFPYGGAGLVSSARDYDRFLHMLANRGTLDGVRVMKPETADLAMSNLLPPGVFFGGIGGGTGGTNERARMGYGAGGSVYLDDSPNGPSKGTYGWGGAAGFVEPGESLEEAVAREVREEAGVLVERVRYVASQPWPFPSQLMIACIGEAVDDALNVDKTELEDARWFTRDQVRSALAGDGPFGAPPPYAIAHNLLRAWLDD